MTVDIPTLVAFVTLVAIIVPGVFWIGRLWQKVDVLQANQATLFRKIDRLVSRIEELIPLKSDLNDVARRVGVLERRKEGD